ncbi:MAG TPA: branched-chain amino acid ABC transporter ATP-binding protein/permease [Acetobacteraceae bacterium]
MSRVLPILLLAFWLVVPVIPGVPNFWITLANYAGLASIVAIGLVVLTGYGGMTSFGQATFMGFGAYATALLTTQAGWSPWLTLPVAMGASGLAALLIGAVTLRLSGHYLALGTIAWAVSLYYLFGNLDLVGRNDGISGIPPLRAGGLALTDSRAYFAVVWVAVAAVLLLTRNLMDSRVGRAIRALRGGAAAAASFGVNLPGTRVLAFTYAAVLAGLAGWLYAHMQRSVNPTPFGLSAGIDYLLMAVLGGAGSVWGALLGAGLVTVVQDVLQDVLPRLLGQGGNYEGIVFGILLVLMLQIAPEGLWPHLRRLLGATRPRVPGASRPAREAPPLPVRTLPARTLPVHGAPVLAVAGLRKTFGGLVAVNDIGLHLDAGEIVGLIGPNGAGKSTTFNLLTGVAQPDAGQIRFQGREVSGSTPPQVAALGIARSFQHVKLVPGMSVLENVALGAHLRGHAGPVRALLRLDRAEEAGLMAEARRQIARVGLAAHADQPADSLALGQQRIVEIARALCLDPVLLLLDEPAAGLRHAEKAELAGLLRRLRGDGMTVLLVEHDMDFVMNLTDRLVVMEFGAKLAEGRPAAVRADARVIEAYLGSVA